MPDPFGDNEALSQDALDALVNSVDNAEKAFSAASEPSVEGIAPAAAAEAPAVSDLVEEDEDEDDDILAAHAAAQALGGSPLRMSSFDAPSVASVPTEDSMSMRGFERVQDIPLELTVELGRTRLLIKDILELRAGSIVELEKMAGEPVDILANGLLVARGEVVVIEDAFGVRITEIITSSERKALAEDQSTKAA
jgi:flagellar motor switch protein FliN/FliY